MNFSERLQQLPSVAHLAALHVSGADGQAPNIDRLLACAESGSVLQVRAVAA
jgi:hypothetical protein